MRPVAAAAVVVAWATAAVVVVGQPSAAFAMSEQLGSGSTAVTTSTPTASSVTAPTATRTTAATCPARSKRFKPTKITLAGVIRNATIVTPPRVNGVPGAPPLTSAGKWQVAMDRKWPIRPGDPYGNFILNAHVWPDGSALGNKMLSKLGVGDRIVVKNPDHKLCYRVVKKVQVSPREALRRYYKVDGRPRIAIVVCSGTRLAPGVWSKRTIWYAAPRA
jgi:hypothetical protein